MSEQFFPKDKADLFRRQHCNGWSDDQFAEFMHAVERFRLDPMARQIHGVIRHDKKRGSVLAIQTGIDGYRLIADRTNALAGNDDAVFIGGHERPPSMATVTVYKMVANTRCPFTASARWDEYYPGDGQGYMWKKMPHVMLGKCAEALALRKAFPAELSGLYTDEEMHQADGKAASGATAKPKPAPAAKPAPAPKPTPAPAAKPWSDMSRPEKIESDPAQYATERVDVASQMEEPSERAKALAEIFGGLPRVPMALQDHAMVYNLMATAWKDDFEALRRMKQEVPKRGMGVELTAAVMATVDKHLAEEPTP